MWLWTLIGLCIITKVHGFANGAPNDERTCKEMSPEHKRSDGTDALPQTTKSPFEVTYKLGQRKEPITVSLQSKSSHKFIGFMLEAREKGMVDGGSPVGKFIPLNPGEIKLLRCSNLEGSAVTNLGNTGKNLIKVNWTAEGAELDVFFRATFVKGFYEFWEQVDVNVVLPPDPTTLPPSTPISTPASTPTSTPTSTPASTPTSTPKFLLVDTTMGDFIVFLVVVKEEFSNIFTFTLTDAQFSRCLIKVFKITCSQLCGALEISTLVLFCVDDPFPVTLVALVCVAIAINIIDLIIVYLPFGPSHELKEMCDLADKLCSVIHIGLITAVVVMVVLEIERKESWLPRVMIAYVAWIFLFVFWVFILNVYKNTKLGIRQLGRSHSVKWGQQRKKELSTCEVIVIAVSLIFNVGTVSFTAAVIVGIFKG